MALISSGSAEKTTHGGFRVEVPLDGAQPGDLVFASATELNSAAAPFLGAAIITINNVAPQANSVLVRGEIGWQSDIRVRVTVTKVLA